MNRNCAVAVLALSLASCGQKGPLYMPDSPQGEVVTRPTPATTNDGTTAAPSNSPSTPDSPGRASSPAPEVTTPPGTPADDSKTKDKKQPPK